jgi:hypothetical protein
VLKKPVEVFSFLFFFSFLEKVRFWSVRTQTLYDRVCPRPVVRPSHNQIPQPHKVSSSNVQVTSYSKKNVVSASNLTYFESKVKFCYFKFFHRWLRKENTLIQTFLVIRLIENSVIMVPNIVKWLRFSMKIVQRCLSAATNHHHLVWISQ